ncbi:hypothetical protein B0H13DRAFT_1904067 [Mycena leptocephala]|nr:hypothetical protein B0H13DRAFT_1904067 [Mycena leptocephala]
MSISIGASGLATSRCRWVLLAVVLFNATEIRHRHRLASHYAELAALSVAVEPPLANLQPTLTLQAAARSLHSTSPVAPSLRPLLNGLTLLGSTLKISQPFNVSTNAAGLALLRPSESAGSFLDLRNVARWTHSEGSLMSIYMPAEHPRIAILCNATKYYSHILLVPVRAWIMTSKTLHKC